MADQPWPRVIQNYPIILISVVYHYIEGVSLLWDQAATNATAAHALALTFGYHTVVGVVVLVACTMGWLGFYAKRKVTTLLCLIPQQLILYIGAGGAFEAIYNGQFADGITRSQAFLLVDQCPVPLMAIFHTWAVILILQHTADRI